MIYISPPEGISTTSPQEQSCPETAFTRDTDTLLAVSDVGMDSSRTSVPANQDIDLYVGCRSISSSLTSLSQNNNQQPTKEERATANAAADRVVYGGRLLKPSDEVVR